MYIEMRNVSKKIKGTVVLDNINYRFEGGNIYGLKGINGSGKTMLMRSICGLIHTDGEIDIDGDILGSDISFPKSIGALLENPAFISSYTGKKNLKLLASIKDIINDEDIDSALKMVGLDCNDKRTYKKYSLGMKQKLGIAAAIMEKPDILILDEPLNAIDEYGITMLRTILENEKNRGAIIIITCHDTEELVKLSDVIINIDDGKII
jgi:ABC-2 type transport system ATP-binding protein